MSNSPLAEYTKFSPNCTSPRNRTIVGISIHHCAGNLSIEACGQVFANPNTQASAHYCVDGSGRIGQYVDEGDRAWCCASREIDNQVVTIEVANDGGAPNWHVSDIALERTIDLCVDICRRNGIGALNWKADKDLLLDDPDQQNLIPHQYCYPTTCPGPYLLSKYQYISDEVNKRLGNPSYKPKTSNQKSNADQFHEFFTDVGLNPYALCGLMGNIYAESGLIPNNLQNSFEKSLGMNDDEYTNSVDDGSYDNFVHDKAGYGLAQWTYWSRKERLLTFAKSSYASIGDMGMQLAYLWKELQESIDIATLNASQSVREASDYILHEFERPADQSEEVEIRRAGYGMEFYNKYYGEPESSESFDPYNVRVVATLLNVRSGPGTNFGINSSIMDQGLYGICDEADGPGASKWGKMSNGWGWISLDYTERE